MDNKIWFDCSQVDTWIEGHQVINNLCVRLKIGESTAILGPNGSGKSSLIKLIDRNLYPVVKQNSHLKLFGSSTVNLVRLRKYMGVISSELEMRFSPKITATELVLSSFFGAMRLGHDQKPNQNEISKTKSLLKKLDLECIADNRFGQLSDGQRRRLMIARALVHEPKVLVLDEPCRALDMKASHQLLRTLRRLCQEGTTLLLVTHQIETIIPEIERVLFIKKGRIHADGTPEQLLQDKCISDLFETPLRIIEHQGFRQVISEE